MVEENQIKVPDIGGATDVDVIEVLVKPGDQIDKETSLITVESDKASMEIPSPKSGVVESVRLKVGDKVSEGDLILTFAASESVDKKENDSPSETKVQVAESDVDAQPSNEQEAETSSQGKTEAALTTKEVNVPDIGGTTEVDVIDVMVKSGDEISKDQSLITLEGDKATMDIPSPYDGVVDGVSIKVGDKVSEGTLILTMQAKAGEEKDKPKPADTKPVEKSETEQRKPQKSEQMPQTADTNLNQSFAGVFAGPAVRRLAREFGVNLKEVKGTGRKSRVLTEDVQNYVKTRLNQTQTAGGLSLPTAPQIDFSKFGEIETRPLNKIKKLTGVNVHRAWLTIPHVTQFDEADITELEAFRKSEQSNAKEAGYKLTVLTFVCKILSKALMEFPQFNSSLDASGENLIYKKYCHIGIAVETPNGLVVPVIKGVNELSIPDLAREMGRLSAKAREKGLSPAEMSGGSMTISSLGGIGGTAFTPIVNHPEVAILGLSRSSMKPVYIDHAFEPRLILPLSLSYDHRVIDGAEAARFARYIAESLADIRRVLL